MKKCKNCIYHDDSDGECERLSLSCRIEYPSFSDSAEEPCIMEYNEVTDDRIVIVDKPEEGIVYRIITPDWFGCVFHVKKVEP